MITQLEDISNRVAQSKISNDRLRNEEIRRRMSDPWAQPVEQQQSYTPKNVYEARSQNPTLATTYSTLLNNARYMEQQGEGRDGPVGDNGYSGRNDISDTLAGNLPGLASTAAGFAGLGAMSPAVGGAVAGLQGNIGGALKGVGTSLGALAGMKGYSGVLGQLAKDLHNDVPAMDMFGNLAKQASLSALFGAVPALGGIYGLASLFGLNMEQGLNDTINGYKGAPGFQGALGGFFGKNALGLGMGMAQPEDTPLGFDDSDLGTGIYGGLDKNTPGFSTSDLGTGLKGSIDTGQFGNWGTSPDTDTDTTGSERGETGDVAGSGTGNSGSEAEGAE